MKIVALIPAYNASRTVAEIIKRISLKHVSEIIVVDDGSRDNTHEVLQGFSQVFVVRHATNRGYGAAQITLYKTALERGADAAVILHADGGHVPEEIPLLIDPVLKGSADVVIGSRTRGIMEQVKPVLGSRTIGAMFQGPMPAYKYLANIALSGLQNLCYGTKYYSFHCGFRAFTSNALRLIPFDQLTTWYNYDTELLIVAHQIGLNILEVPVSAFYDDRAGSSVPVVRYGLRIVQHALRYRMNGRKLPLASVKTSETVAREY